MKRRAQQREQKRQARKNRANNPKGNSKYAKKRAYCLRNGVWGFEVAEPKPWK